MCTEDRQKFLGIKKSNNWTSLVVQCLGIHLPMQGTLVRSLICEDSTGHKATKSKHHNYWICILVPMDHNYRACAPTACPLHQQKPWQKEVHTTTKNSPCLHNWKPRCSNEDLVQPKIKTNFIKSSNHDRKTLITVNP